MTEPLDLDPIKHRLEAATPGPWHWRASRYLFDPDDRIVAHAPTGPNNNQQGHDIHIRHPDADMIANAPTDIEALITEVERLRALVDHQPVTIHITKPEPDTRVVGVPVIVEGPLRERYR